MGSVALLAACAADPSINAGISDSKVWQRVVDSAVPHGTSGDSAVARLRRNGFQCTEPDAPESLVACSKQQKVDAVVQRVWVVGFVLHGARVDQVQGRVALTSE